MPSERGKLDARDKARANWSVLTMGVPATVVAQIGPAIATIIIKTWLPDADVELQNAVNTLSVAITSLAAIGAAWWIDRLRMRYTDTRST